MKRFLWLALASLLIAPSSQSQEVFFDFEEFSQIEQWDQLAGFWDVFEGFFTEIEDAGGPLVAATEGIDRENYRVVVRAQGLVADADWGIAFNIQDINNHYSWQFVNGSLQFIKYVDGARTSLFTEPLAEELEIWQEFEVVVNGSTFDIYFDGVHKATIEDSDLPPGRVGLFSWVNSGSELGDMVGFTAFDNFLVTTEELWTLNRSLPSETYRLDQSIQDIEITANVTEGETVESLTITEFFPPELSVSNVEPEGTVDETAGTITWTLENVSGSETVSYDLQAPSDQEFGAIQLRGNADDGRLIRHVPRATIPLTLDSVVIEDELFFDFEEAAQDEQWTDLSGDWGIQDGLFYEFADADGPLVAVTGDPNVTDYTLTVEAQGLVADADWGLAFRVQDIDNHYSWQFQNANLVFVRYFEGASNTLFSVEQEEVLNEWQEFRVDVRGDTFDCYFDGELITSVTDNTLAWGQVGLIGWINAGSPVQENIGGIVFDNFSATAPTSVSGWMLY